MRRIRATPVTAPHRSTTSIAGAPRPRSKGRWPMADAGIDAKEERRTIDWSRFVAPLVLGLLALGAWEGLVRAWKIPAYLLPGPILIFQTLITDWGTLMESWWVTMSI